MNLRNLAKIFASVLLAVVFLLIPVNSTYALANSLEANKSIPLFNNLGEHNYPISTQSELTQQYFNQGLTLAYGFNHAEAARSFQAGIQHDANCAMCYWGLAYVLGPNINAPMGLDAVPTTWEAIQQARALSSKALPRERALIEALATRYVADPNIERDALDQAYAQAMQEV
ncbi:MAG: hypothetical protein F6K11_07540, partial [Leptolyngbya sp. SIO3F4]|nr:hypothetical protein [Leptolyngbya sp. SIO3F4]